MKQRRGTKPRKALPRKKNPADLRSLARSQTANAVNVLIGLMRSKKVNNAIRMGAAIHLLDRGHGKPAQAHTGADGEEEIRITIRNIMEGKA
jgi:ribosomal protein S12